MTKLCRAAAAAAVALGLGAGAEAQDFEFLKLSNALLGDGVVLDIVNGGPEDMMAQLTSSGNYSGQFWVRRDIGVPGYFALSTEFTGPDMCLDVILNSDRYFHMMRMETCGGHESQQWTVFEKGDGFAWVHNRAVGGAYCLSFTEEAGLDGLAQLDPCDDDAPEQYWRADATGRYAQ